MTVLKRFLKYVSFDTQSNPKSKSIPSTAKQRELGAYLVEEMKQIGIEDARLDEYGYVYGSIKGNVSGAKTVGFIAHMDTSYEVSGANVKPRVISNYDGNDIALNEQYTTKVADFPFLKEFKGKTLVVTDGTTLLGADDKAGLAEIMTMAEYLISHPEILHGDIKIAFTPDEEIGRGADYFDVAGFNADFAYTLDGDKVGVIEYENFNAASVQVTIKGISIHPGSSKNKMKNALNIAWQFHDLLPQHARPEYTENYEGFIHLNEMDGTVELVNMHYIIRDHDMDSFNQFKTFFKQAQELINQRYGENTITIEIKDTYYNMKEKLADKMYIVSLAEAAIKAVGITPSSKPIRGGTDGAVLTYKGLPCPNLGTGGYNYHGRNELCVVEEMEQSVQIILEIIKQAVNL